MKKSIQQPAVGVAAIVVNNNKILIGRRLSAPMEGSWQLPGGWLRAGEDPVMAVARKLADFSGLNCDKTRFVTYTNNLFESGLHTISLYFELNCLNADTVELNLNQDCGDWFWADWYDLPQPLFYPLQLLIESGYVPLGGH